MRFVYNDPYALRGALERLADEPPIGTRRDRDLPIPLDVYQQGNEIVIEGGSPRRTAEDLDITGGYREVGARSSRHNAGLK